MLTQYPNDTSREARPGLWIFRGRTLVILVASVAMGVSVFKSLVTLLDWPVAAGIALIPFALATLFVWRFINGRPKSYAGDWLLLAIFKLKTYAYLAGAKDRPSALWIKDKHPRHPKCLS
jgi:hypothetical protein